jgi:hypothetical protein
MQALQSSHFLLYRLSEASKNGWPRKLPENISLGSWCRIVSNFAIIICGLSAMGMPVEKAVPASVATPRAGTPAVTNYPQPPAGFDPFSASNAELAKYGFPPRPDPLNAPEAYEHWRRMVSVPRIANPSFHQTKIYNGPAQLGPARREPQ